MRLGDDKDVISKVADFAGGDRVAFNGVRFNTVDAVPEPSSLAILSGVVLVGLARRRRK